MRNLLAQNLIMPLILTKISLNGLIYKIIVFFNTNKIILIKYLKKKITELSLFAVSFDAINVALNIKFIISKCSYEAERQEYLQDMVKDNNDI